jgi:predicted GIY-YIG superfamily endonuclease
MIRGEVQKGRHHVYALSAARSGLPRVVYVGCTANPNYRLSRHRCDQAEPIIAMHIIERFDRLADALQYETTLIRRHNPEWNKRDRTDLPQLHPKPQAWLEFYADADRTRAACIDMHRLNEACSFVLMARGKSSRELAAATARQRRHDLQSLPGWRAKPPGSTVGATMSERTDADYAIEFGEYLASAASDAIQAFNEHLRDIETMDPDEIDNDPLADALSRLRSDIYEFRKRAARAGHEPSAAKFNR